MKSLLPLTFILCLTVVSTASASGRVGNTLADWWRVRTLPPQTRIIVEPKGAQPGVRFFVKADDTELVVINVVNRGRGVRPDWTTERISRTDVAEVRSPRASTQRPGRKALIGGAIIGGAAALAFGRDLGANFGQALVGGAYIGGIAASAIFIADAMHDSFPALEVIYRDR
jgi:hypothetical protein